MNELDLQKPLFQLTAGEFLALLKQSIAETSSSPEGGFPEEGKQGRGNEETLCLWNRRNSAIVQLQHDNGKPDKEKWSYQQGNIAMRQDDNR